MSKILAVKPITTKAGRPMVLVQTVDRPLGHFVTRAQWDGHKLSPAFDAYVGGQFLSDYFQKGDLLLSGDVVEDDNIILRDFSASMNPIVVAQIAGMLINQETAQASEATALFAAKRAAETPEQTAARRKAVADARVARVAAAKPADPATV